jgi:hypothetical protein
MTSAMRPLLFFTTEGKRPEIIFQPRLEEISPNVILINDRRQEILVNITTKKKRKKWHVEVCPWRVGASDTRPLLEPKSSNRWVVLENMQINPIKES